MKCSHNYWFVLSFFSDKIFFDKCVWNLWTYLPNLRVASLKRIHEFKANIFLYNRELGWTWYLSRDGGTGPRPGSGYLKGISYLSHCIIDSFLQILILKIIGVKLGANKMVQFYDLNCGKLSIIRFFTYMISMVLNSH